MEGSGPTSLNSNPPTGLVDTESISAFNPMFGATSASLGTDKAQIHFKTASNNMKQLQTAGAFALDEKNAVALTQLTASQINDPMAHAVLDALCICN